jgi:hypothetical protein
MKTCAQVPTKKHGLRREEGKAQTRKSEEPEHKKESDPARQ